MRWGSACVTSADGRKGFPDPWVIEKHRSCKYFFIFDGAGLDDVHAKDGLPGAGDLKWEIVRWCHMKGVYIFLNMAVSNYSQFESPASGAEPLVRTMQARFRTRISRRLLYGNPFCRAWLAHHNMSSHKIICGLTILWKLNYNFFE